MFLATSGKFKASMGQIDAGLKDYEAALAELPNNLQFWQDYEFFLRQKGDMAKAAVAQKEITRLSE